MWKLVDGGVICMEERINAIDIAGEERRFFHVREPKHLLGEAFKTHSPPSVWRQTVFERLKVVRELSWVEPLHLDALNKIVVVVSTLSAGRYLHAAEKEVET